LLVPLLALLLVSCASPGHLPDGLPPAVSAEGLVFAGAGEADLTPTLDEDHPLPLAGYGNRRGRPFHGVHDHVWARALALAAGNVTVVVVSADLLLIPDQLAQRIREQVADLKLDALLLAATHDHSGPGGFFDNWLAEMVALGPYDEHFTELLAARIAGAVRAAQRDLRPARIGYALGTAEGLNRNRRIDDGPVDPTLAVLRVDRAAETLATVVNFAAHATVLSGDNFLISGDYPGALAAELKARGVRYPLFLNGSAGDLSARSPISGPGFDKVAAIGKALADRVAALLPTIAMQDHVRLAASRTELPLPAKSTHGTVGTPLDWLLTPVLSGFIPERTNMQAIAIGDLTLVSFPCDLNVLVGRQLQDRFAGRTVLPISYADDYMGYVVDPDNYDHRWYEATLSFYGRDIGSYLVAWGSALVQAVGPAP
jgi:hypothetical protein